MLPHDKVRAAALWLCLLLSPGTSHGSPAAVATTHRLEARDPPAGPSDGWQRPSLEERSEIVYIVSRRDYFYVRDFGIPSSVRTDRPQPLSWELADTGAAGPGGRLLAVVANRHLETAVMDFASYWQGKCRKCTALYIYQIQLMGQPVMPVPRANYPGMEQDEELLHRGIYTTGPWLEARDRRLLSYATIPAGWRLWTKARRNDRLREGICRLPWRRPDENAPPPKHRQPSRLVEGEDYGQTAHAGPSSQSGPLGVLPLGAAPPGMPPPGAAPPGIPPPGAASAGRPPPQPAPADLQPPPSVPAAEDLLRDTPEYLIEGARAAFSDDELDDILECLGRGAEHNHVGSHAFPDYPPSGQPDDAMCSFTVADLDSLFSFLGPGLQQGECSDVERPPRNPSHSSAGPSHAGAQRYEVVGPEMEHYDDEDVDVSQLDPSLLSAAARLTPEDLDRAVGSEPEQVNQAVGSDPGQDASMDTSPELDGESFLSAAARLTPEDLDQAVGSDPEQVNQDVGSEREQDTSMDTGSDEDASMDTSPEHDESFMAAAAALTPEDLDHVLQTYPEQDGEDDCVTDPNPVQFSEQLRWLIDRHDNRLDSLFDDAEAVLRRLADGGPNQAACAAAMNRFHSLRKRAVVNGPPRKSSCCRLQAVVNAYARESCFDFSHLWFDLKLSNSWGAGTYDEIMVDIGNQKISLLQHPSRGQNSTREVNLKAAFGSSKIPVWKVQKFVVYSLPDERVLDDEWVIEKITLTGRCAGSQRDAQVVIPVNQILSRFGDKFDYRGHVKLHDWRWASEDAQTRSLAVQPPGRPWACTAFKALDVNLKLSKWPWSGTFDYIYLDMGTNVMKGYESVLLANGSNPGFDRTTTVDLAKVYGNETVAVGEILRERLLLVSRPAPGQSPSDSDGWRIISLSLTGTCAGSPMSAKMDNLADIDEWLKRPEGESSSEVLHGGGLRLEDWHWV